MSINSIRGSGTYESINTSNNNKHISSNISNNIDSNNIHKEVSSISDTEKEPTDEMFHKVVEEINKQISFINRRFEYEIHEGTNKVIVRIFNSSNDEMVREIPPESRLDAIAKMWEMSGIIVDSVV